MYVKLKNKIKKGEGFQPFKIELKIETEEEFLSLLTLTGDTKSRLLNEISSYRMDVVLDSDNYYILFDFLDELYRDFQ